MCYLQIYNLLRNKSEGAWLQTVSSIVIVPDVDLFGQNKKGSSTLIGSGAL